MTTYRTSTYADGFGVWHCEVETTGAVSHDQATALALAEITQAVTERNDKDVVFGVNLDSKTSRDGSLTYFFTEAVKPATYNSRGAQLLRSVTDKLTPLEW